MCRWLLSIVYSVASYRPHLSHFWANVTVISKTEFNASRLLNIKTTAGTIFQPQIFLFLNPCLPEFSYPKNPENLRFHSSNSTKNVTHYSQSSFENATPSSGTSLGSSILLGSTPRVTHICYRSSLIYQVSTIFAKTKHGTPAEKAGFPHLLYHTNIIIT